jgi:hypothetical protein
MTIQSFTKKTSLENLVQKYSISLPKICEYKNGLLEVQEKNGSFYLYENSQQWMIYTPEHGIQLMEFYSHFYLGFGTVVCTGLGFALRESWLLTKPEVHKLIVVEKSEEVIKYHQKHNPDLLAKMTIIHGDAKDLNLECDCLLLDHFEMESHEMIISEVKEITSKVKHKVFWFWPLEKIIYIESTRSSTRFIDYYLNFRESNSLTTLPELNLEELDEFLQFYFNYSLMSSKKINK